VAGAPRPPRVSAWVMGTRVPVVDIAVVLAALYESEIDCRLKSFWDDGWHLALGDHMNEFEAATTE